MALNLKNPEVERLAAEVARLTSESKAEAIRRALEERRRRLKAVAPAERRRRVVSQGAPGTASENGPYVAQPTR